MIKFTTHDNIQTALLKLLMTDRLKVLGKLRLRHVANDLQLGLTSKITKEILSTLSTYGLWPPPKSMGYGVWESHGLCRKKEKYLDIYTKVIPASRESGVLDNLDIETTPLACPSQGYLKACQGASIMTSRPYKVFSNYYLVSQRISRYLPCHGRLGFPTSARLNYRTFQTK